MQELIAGLMVWAVNLSGYTAVAANPALETVTHQQLIDTLCEGKPCSALAYYDDKKNTIFYDENLPLDQVDGQAFIVHEMVHFLQYQNHAVPEEEPSCTQRMLLEREAYVVQQHFLRQHHQMTYQVDLAIRMLGHVCRE